MEELNGRALLGDQQGLGKTLQALWYVRRNKVARPVIVLCPAHLKLNWQREAARHIDMPAEILGGLNPPRSNIPNTAQMFIVNYDVLAPSYRKGKGGHPVNYPGWLKWLKALQPQVIIADEAHYLGSLKAARTRAWRRLCRGVPHVLVLTGTPISNRVKGLFPLVNTLWPEVEEFRSFPVFGHTFCGAKKEYGRWKFDGATNIPQLRELLLKSGLIRRLKKDVLADLPPVIRSVVPIELEHGEKYKEAFHQFVQWLRVYGKDSDKARQGDRLKHYTYLKGLVGKLKLKAVLEWVTDFLQSGDKLLLFGIHRQFVHKVYENFKDCATYVTGEVTGKERQLRFDQFNQDRDCRLFVGNIDAAGTGWNCTAASHVAFGELAWNAAKHAQAESRAHGLFRGVEGVGTNAYYLIADGTMERRLCKLIFQKQDTADNALDGTASEGDFDLLRLLEQELVGGLKT